MQKTLNVELLETSSKEHGFNQTAIAKQLGVTRAAVSKWMNGQSFPRPAELLKLGKLLELSFQELVLTPKIQDEPLVAFRKRGSCKTTSHHIDRAKKMGNALSHVVPYLDIDPFRGPQTLKNPSTDYDYLQALALRLRQEMNVGETDVIKFENLIDHFHQTQAILIPVMWGKKTAHENAIHIHLPESKTTWIYLNLDVILHDFKFWIAHELGHALTLVMLTRNEIDAAEEFADAFSGALLFPEAIASSAFEEYSAQPTNTKRIACLMRYAALHVISPNSVYKEIQSYASAKGLEIIELTGNSLFTKIAAFNKQYSLVSKLLFDATPSANLFMRVAGEEFKTQFYKALSDYTSKTDPGRSRLSTLLGVSPMDASAFEAALKA